MSYDDIIEVLAAALLEKANEVGCLEVLDGFSQRPDTEIEVSAPISEEMLALPLDRQLYHKDRRKPFWTFTMGFEEAQAFRRANGGYLRKNQWEDLTVDVYI